MVSVTAEPTPAPVYNLTVDGCPEYFANGILVHNCWNLTGGRRKGEEPVKALDDGMDQTRYAVAHFDLAPRAGRPASAGGRPAPAGSPYRGASAYGPRGGAGYGPRG